MLVGTPSADGVGLAPTILRRDAQPSLSTSDRFRFPGYHWDGCASPTDVSHPSLPYRLKRPQGLEGEHSGLEVARPAGAGGSQLVMRQPCAQSCHRAHVAARVSYTFRCRRHENAWATMFAQGRRQKAFKRLGVLIPLIDCGL